MASNAEEANEQREGCERESQRRRVVSGILGQLRGEVDLVVTGAVPEIALARIDARTVPPHPRTDED